MTVTKLQREEAEANANRVQLYLYGEPESGEQLWNIGLKFDLTENTLYNALARMIGDTILGFYKQSDLLQLIKHTFPSLTEMKQLELELEIKKFLLPLSSQEGTLSSITPNEELKSEIAETEKEIGLLQTVRTMAHDMEVVQGHPVMQAPAAETTYQSSQADILRPAAPAPVVNETPRWDTE